MNLLSKIKACKTMKELDELRYDIVKAAQENPNDFITMQAAFVHKMNSLSASGHTRFSEGYTLNEILQEHRKQEESK